MGDLAEGPEDERDLGGLVEGGGGVDRLGRDGDGVGVDVRAQQIVGPLDRRDEVGILAGGGARRAERHDELGRRVQVDRALLLGLQVEQRRAQDRAGGQREGGALLGGVAAGGGDEHDAEKLATKAFEGTGIIGGCATDLGADDPAVPAVDRDGGADDGLGQVDLPSDGAVAEVVGAVGAGERGQRQHKDRGDAGQRRARLRHGGLGAGGHGRRGATASTNNTQRGRCPRRSASCRQRRGPRRWRQRRRRG